MDDLLLRGGDVIDGTGAARRRADVSVTGGVIMEVGNLATCRASRVLDVTGLVVTPGFVDVHSHSDMILAMPRERQIELMRGRMLQGITTEMVGNCGLGVFPIDESSREPVARFHQFLIPDGAEIAWRSTGDYLTYLEDRGIPVNVATLAPHNPIRIKAMGPTDRDPTRAEIKTMRLEVEAALNSGALGLSFGLIYFPGRFTKTSELTELAGVVAERGGMVAFHQRSGSPEVVMQAVDEIIEVGEKSGAHVHLSHDHVQGRPGWHLFEEILQKEQEARERGLRFTQDVIPYTGVTTTMLAIYPPWALAGGVEGFLELAADPGERAAMKRDMDNVVPSWPPWREGAWATNIVRDCGWSAVFVGHVGSRRNRPCEGLSAVELGALRGTEPFDAITDILLEEGGDVGLRLIGISGDLEDEGPLIGFMQDPSHALISDAWDVGRGKPHPGVYGAFPRVLGLYVRERGLFSLEEAIRKMTSLPASILGLDDRGRIAPGYRADLVIIDPETVGEAATYEAPRAAPHGIEHVFVNGKCVASQERIDVTTAGEVLRASGR